FALKIVFRYIYNYDEALEITNDGFVKFFLSIDSFRCDDEAALEKVACGWLKRIMINTAIDLLRKKMFLPEIGGITEHHMEIPHDAEAADQKMVYKEIIQLVKKLPPPYSVVFNMYVIDGYSHLEIAESLNIPLGTSRSHLLRARNMMGKYLNQTEAVLKCSI
ncbi:MAG: RNA polymerase sigma factor, partial [Ferruginibacter sp.]